MAICLGLDSSTQSLSALVIDTTKSTVLLEKSVNFGKDLPQYGCPNGFLPNGAEGEVHAPPMMWLEALDLLLQGIVDNGFDLGQVEAVSGSGQQHGSVYLDDSFPSRLSALSPGCALAEQLHPALTRETSPIWMDHSTSSACRDIEQAVGGPLEVCRRSGSIAVERFTGPQIRRFSQTAPEAYAKTAHIHLVSSFLASVLTGQRVPIDYGDGAGMNLMHLADRQWDAALLAATAERLEEKLPDLIPSSQVAGKISPYFQAKYGFSSACQTVVWSGDNPCSLIGMGAASPGKVVISLGTSDTLFASMPEPLTDPNGYGHVFGNPWGGYMSLVCFRNGSLAREALKAQLGVEWSAFEQASQSEFLTDDVMLPFVEAEITPRATATGFRCSTSDQLSPQQKIRLLLEGQFLNMKLQSQWMELNTEEVFVTGGASDNHGICQIIANVFGLPVKRLTTTSSACLGAALRAAEAACSADKQQLEQAYCQVEADSAIAPEASLSDLYTRKLQSFDQLLRSEA